MAAFLYVQSFSSPLRAESVATMADSFGQMVPRFNGCEISCQVQETSGEQHCLIYSESAPNGNGAITVAQDDEHLVVGAGTFPAGDNRKVADVAMEHVHGNRWEKLRELDGSFAVLWFNKASRDVRALNDFLGRKTVRFVESGNKLAISSNDLLLPLTGMCGDDGIDDVGAVSILAMDFYSRGRSLIQNVKTLTAHEYLEAQNGVVSIRTWQNPVELARSQSKAKSRSEQLAKMREHFGSLLDGGLTRYPAIKCDLTGGQDSRALFSAIVSSDHKDRVRFEYRGGETSNDCKVGRRLARRYGMPFSNKLFEPPSDYALKKNAEALVFFGNAQVNCKRAFDGLATGNPQQELHLSGIGAEFFRGYYYKEKLLLGRKRNMDWACEGLAKYYVPAEIPGINKELHEKFRELFKNDLEEIAGLTSKDGYDATDFWYLYERFSRWGGAYMGLPWMRDFWAPFSNHELVRMGMAIKPPMGRSPSLVDELVRTHTPAAYWMPTNNGLIMALPGRYLAKGLCSLVGRLWSKCAGRKPVPLTSQGNPDRFRSDSMAGECFDDLSGILLAQGNYLSSLFDDGAVKNILSEHRTGGKSKHNLLGNMLTLCVFEKMLKRATVLGQKARL